MKIALVSLYIIVAVQSVIIVFAFWFTFASIEKGFEYAGANFIKIADQRYALKSQQ